jgi:hypothetical protein
MTTLIMLLLATGLAPLALGTALTRHSPRPGWRFPPAGSVLLCALAFNLTFFWQELWLVIPKALTPGLHPILYHNDHDWTGRSPDLELLQGTGMLATLASGLAFSGGLVLARGASPTWRLFLFWMAFQGLYQSLSQLAIGTLLPGNDVGRALAWMRLGPGAKGALLAFAMVAMALSGAGLASASATDGEPAGARGSRAFLQETQLTAMLAVALIIPFRIPRDFVEVALIPLFVNLLGTGWLALGAGIVARGSKMEDPGRVSWKTPALALGVTLLVFQCVLRPGISL